MAPETKVQRNDMTPYDGFFAGKRVIVPGGVGSARPADVEPASRARSREDRIIDSNEAGPFDRAQRHVPRDLIVEPVNKKFLQNDER